MGFFAKALSCFKGSRSKKKGVVRGKEGGKDADSDTPASSGRPGPGAEKKSGSTTHGFDVDQRFRRNMELFEKYVQKLRSGDGAGIVDDDDDDERLKKSSGWMVMRAKTRSEATSIMGGSMRYT